MRHPRPLKRALLAANLGRVLFFDRAGGLHDDNICAGCHAPGAGFGDTQSIAIGVQNNLVVGPDRTGPRNQRRSPSVVNTAFYPSLKWNGRFSVPSGDPFDGSLGFLFPVPEGTTAFPPNDPLIKHLLIAQAHIPPTELVEVAGFTGTKGTKGTISPRFDQFDDGKGCVVPLPDGSGFRNEPIRQAVLARLNGNAQYRQRFGALFPSVAAGGPIDFTMFGRAIAEFDLDRYKFRSSPLRNVALQPAFFHNGAFICSQPSFNDGIGLKVAHSCYLTHTTTLSGCNSMSP